MSELQAGIPSQHRASLRAWRQSLRAELLTRRVAAVQERRTWNRAIEHWLARGFSALSYGAAGAYWPYRGEFDPRPTMRLLVRCGVRIGLPAVVARNAPLEFREWRPGVETRPGALDIPVPVATRIVSPDALLIPLVGFDAAGYRLGYGGGYFDRTLGAMTPQPLKIGVGFELSRIPTIRPQWHDVPMDFILTEAGIGWVSRAGLIRVAETEAAEIAGAILARRRCPAHGYGETARYSSPPCYAHQFELPDDEDPRS